MRPRQNMRRGQQQGAEYSGKDRVRLQLAKQEAGQKTERSRDRSSGDEDYAVPACSRVRDRKSDLR